MVTARSLSRRRMLSLIGLGLLGAGPGRTAQAGQGMRIAAIDWAMAETAIALGAPVTALAELRAFRRAAPQLDTTSATDLGLRGAPNLEALSLIGADLILSSNYYAFVEPQLARIAPVFSRAIYVPGHEPFPRVMTLLDGLGARLGVPDHAAHTRAGYEASFARLAAQARPFARRDLLLIQIGDARHMRVFGHDSLFGGAVTALGLRNAWGDGTRFAFAAPVPITHLARFAQTALVIVGDVPHQARRALSRGALWNSLPQVRAGRVHHLPEFSAFGAIPSALAFATALVAALEQQA